jgi:hypothetical protein
MPGLFEVPQNPPKLLAKNPATWRGIQAIVCHSKLRWHASS